MKLWRPSLILLAGALAAQVLSAKKPQPALDWKMGILWESPDPCDDTSAVYKETFIVLADDTVYHLSHTPLLHKPNVAEGKPVKYATAQGDFYLQDANGRVFKLAVVKKELDPNAQEQLKIGKRPCQP